MVERELPDATNILPLSNPMAIFNLINSAEEDEATHMESNDSKIIQMVQDDEEEEEEQVELVEASKEDTLKFLSVTAFILDSSIPADRVFIGVFVSFRFPSVWIPPLRAPSIVGFTR